MLHSLAAALATSDQQTARTDTTKAFVAKGIKAT
jgi:hypothetical protein